MQFLDYKINTISNIAVGFHMHRAQLINYSLSNLLEMCFSHQRTTKSALCLEGAIINHGRAVQVWYTKGL